MIMVIYDTDNWSRVILMFIRVLSIAWVYKYSFIFVR